MNSASPPNFSSVADRTAAEWACVKLVYEFGRLVDAHDYEALVQLFDEDAEFNRPSEPEKIIKGRGQLLENFKSRPNYVSAHLFSNVQVTADSPMHATGHSYLIMYTASTNSIGPLGIPSANAEARIGSFTEKFIHSGGKWLFRKRVGRMIMTTTVT